MTVRLATAEPLSDHRLTARAEGLAAACGTVPRLRPAKGFAGGRPNPGFPLRLPSSMDAPHGPDVNRGQPCAPAPRDSRAVPGERKGGARSLAGIRRAQVAWPQVTGRPGCSPGLTPLRGGTSAGT
jgi:hypothetical protein